MTVTVKIPTPLRKIAGGQDRATVEGSTLEAVIDALESEFPGMKSRICDESGQVRHFVNIYVNGEDIRYLEGLGTPAKNGDEVSIVPAVAGGSRLEFY